jgi:hypothetical protein
VARVLKPLGVLVIWTPNMDSLSGLVMRILPHSLSHSLKRVFIGEGSYPHYYLSNNPAMLDTMLSEAGFSRAQMRMIDGVFYFSELKIVRMVHSMIIKLTNCQGLKQFKDLIFAVYVKT